MLTYVYEHLDSKEQFQVRQSIHDGALAVCPRCHEPVRRVVQPATILYKGWGWPRKDGAADARVEKRLAAGDIPRYEVDDYYSPGEADFGPLS